MTPNERPLRVLMVCPRYFPEVGGTETHVREVARRISGLGSFEITVLTTDRSRELPRQQVVDGITVLRVPAWPRGRDYYLAPGIATVIGQRGWDLVHCQGIHTPVPLLAMISARRRHPLSHHLPHRRPLVRPQERHAGHPMAAGGPPAAERRVAYRGEPLRGCRLHAACPSGRRAGHRDP